MIIRRGPRREKRRGEVEGFGPTGPKPDDSRTGWFSSRRSRSSEWSNLLSVVASLSVTGSPLVVAPPVGG